jgi:alpha-beta hydrolase superfamily lysophospholipase
MVQLRYLEQYLDVIHERDPHESLLLAGHSAGGVLGLLYMVTHPDKPVGALITFASPPWVRKALKSAPWEPRDGTIRFFELLLPTPT